MYPMHPKISLSHLLGSGIVFQLFFFAPLRFIQGVWDLLWELNQKLDQANIQIFILDQSHAKISHSQIESW